MELGCEADRFKTAQSVMALELKMVLCLPLVHAGEVLGVIYTDSQSVQEPLGASDLEVALALSQQAAAAISAVRRIDRAEAPSRSLEAPSRSLEAPSRSLEAVARLAPPAAAGDTKAFYMAAILSAIEIAGAERGFILQGGNHTCVAAFDREGRPLDTPEHTFSTSVCVWSYATEESINVLDASQDERWAQQQSVMTLDLRTVHCVPIPGNGNPWGLLYLDSQDVTRSETQGLEEVAGVLGAFVGR